MILENIIEISLVNLDVGEITTVQSEKRAIYLKRRERTAQVEVVKFIVNSLPSFQCVCVCVCVCVACVQSTKSHLLAGDSIKSSGDALKPCVARTIGRQQRSRDIYVWRCRIESALGRVKSNQITHDILSYLYTNEVVKLEMKANSAGRRRETLQPIYWQSLRCSHRDCLRSWLYFGGLVRQHAIKN